uniref:uncharacterized protein isoform X1 n=3 Tax=Myxine glutinosa TaxID=7769 RepID=UPI00358F2C8F
MSFTRISLSGHLKSVSSCWQGHPGSASYGVLFPVRHAVPAGDPRALQDRTNEDTDSRGELLSGLAGRRCVAGGGGRHGAGWSLIPQGTSGWISTAADATEPVVCAGSRVGAAWWSRRAAPFYCLMHPELDRGLYNSIYLKEKKSVQRKGCRAKHKKTPRYQDWAMVSLCGEERSRTGRRSSRVNTKQWVAEGTTNAETPTSQPLVDNPRLQRRFTTRLEIVFAATKPLLSVKDSVSLHKDVDITDTCSLPENLRTLRKLAECRQSKLANITSQMPVTATAKATAFACENRASAYNTPNTPTGNKSLTFASRITGALPSPAFHRKNENLDREPEKNYLPERKEPERTSSKRQTVYRKNVQPINTATQYSSRSSVLSTSELDVTSSQKELGPEMNSKPAGGLSNETGERPKSPQNRFIKRFRPEYQNLLPGAYLGRQRQQWQKTDKDQSSGMRSFLSQSFYLLKSTTLGFDIRRSKKTQKEEVVSQESKENIGIYVLPNEAKTAQAIELPTSQSAIKKPVSNVNSNDEHIPPFSLYKRSIGSDTPNSNTGIELQAEQLPPSSHCPAIKVFGTSPDNKVSPTIFKPRRKISSSDSTREYPLHTGLTIFNAQPFSNNVYKPCGSPVHKPGSPKYKVNDGSPVQTPGSPNYKVYGSSPVQKPLGANYMRFSSSPVQKPVSPNYTGIGGSPGQRPVSPNYTGDGNSPVQRTGSPNYTGFGSSPVQKPVSPNYTGFGGSPGQRPASPNYTGDGNSPVQRTGSPNYTGFGSSPVQKPVSPNYTVFGSTPVQRTGSPNYTGYSGSPVQKLGSPNCMGYSSSPVQKPGSPNYTGSPVQKPASPNDIAFNTSCFQLYEHHSDETSTRLNSLPAKVSQESVAYMSIFEESNRHSWHGSRPREDTKLHPNTMCNTKIQEWLGSSCNNGSQTRQNKDVTYDPLKTKIATDRGEGRSTQGPCAMQLPNRLHTPLPSVRPFPKFQRSSTMPQKRGQLLVSYPTYSTLASSQAYREMSLYKEPLIDISSGNKTESRWSKRDAMARCKSMNALLEPGNDSTISNAVVEQDRVKKRTHDGRDLSLERKSTSHFFIDQVYRISPPGGYSSKLRSYSGSVPHCTSPSLADSPGTKLSPVANDARRSSADFLAKGRISPFASGQLGCQARCQPFGLAIDPCAHLSNHSPHVTSPSLTDWVSMVGADDVFYDREDSDGDSNTTLSDEYYLHENVQPAHRKRRVQRQSAIIETAV